MGYYDCSTNKLTTLKGCPKNLGGDFYCRSNQLKYLDFLPTEIKKEIKIYCGNNPFKNDLYNELESSNVYTYLLNEKLSKKINQNIKTNQVLKNKTKI